MKKHVHKPFDESKLTDAEKNYLKNAPEHVRKLIYAGRPIIIKSLVDDSVYEYNLDNVYISEHAAKAFARAILPSIREFYSKEENIRAFEEWQEKQQQKNDGRKNT